MFILIGTSLSGKTFFIKKYIQKLNISKINIKQTYDIKPYVFRNSYVIDTPDINQYNNLDTLIKQCNTVLNNPKTEINIIYFIHKYEDTNLSIKRWMYLKKNKNINLILFDPLQIIQIKNLDIDIIDTYSKLINIIIDKSKNNLKNINNKSVVLVGITNVGKTSILNDLIKDNIFRISGNKNTTKELTFSIYNYNNCNFKIYDTCGIENNTRSKILGISNLIKYVNRVIIVMDRNTYYQKSYQYIFNFLNKNLINITFLINKSDLITSSEKENIIDFIQEKYKVNERDLFFNNTIGNSNTKSNIEQILSINKKKINHHLLNNEIKKNFPDILYINESKDENSIYEINVYMKRKINVSLNLSYMIKKLRNLIYKLIKTKHFAIKFNIIKSPNKNKENKCEYNKRKNNKSAKTIKYNR